MERKKLEVEPGEVVEAILDLHLRFFRQVNDLAIFVTKSLPLIREHADDSAFAGDFSKIIEKYEVTGAEKASTSKRSRGEVQQLLRRYVERDVYVNCLITAVSRFESCLFDTARLVLERFPTRLTIGLKGGESLKTMEVGDFIDLTREKMLAKLIRDRLQSIGYKGPEVYLAYFGSVMQFDATVTCFQKYMEVKATRDIVIHGDGIANDQYEKKAGDEKRAESGEELVVDEAYFQLAVRTMKQCSKRITDNVETQTMRVKAEPQAAKTKEKPAKK